MFLVFRCRLQRWADTNFTLAFEDVQVLPFFMEKTDDRDYIDDTDDTDDTGTPP